VAAWSRLRRDRLRPLINERWRNRIKWLFNVARSGNGGDGHTTPWAITVAANSMAPPGPIIAIAVAMAVFSAISGVALVALIWRVIRPLPLLNRLIVAVIAIGLLAAYFALMLTVGSDRELIFLSIAVIASILVWITWIAIWLSSSRRTVRTEKRTN